MPTIRSEDVLPSEAEVLCTPVSLLEGVSLPRLIVIAAAYRRQTQFGFEPETPVSLAEASAMAQEILHLRKLNK